MKQQIDKHGTEREFDVGDWVFLRLQPYRQASIKVRASLKIYGPYKMLLIVSDLPIGSKIHLVLCLVPKEEIWQTYFLKDTCQMSLPVGKISSKHKLQWTNPSSSNIIGWLLRSLFSGTTYQLRMRLGSLIILSKRNFWSLLLINLEDRVELKGRRMVCLFIVVFLGILVSLLW